MEAFIKNEYSMGRWLRSIGLAEEVAQAEFTWCRVADSVTNEPGWTYEVLDVVGTNNKGYATCDIQTSSRRCDDIPHPRASDHWPVAMKWHRGL